MAPTISVDLQDATAAADARLVERLTNLVNDVYATAEAGLWRSGATRTRTALTAELIGAGEIAVATLDGAIAGMVRVHAVSDATGAVLRTPEPERFAVVFRGVHPAPARPRASKSPPAGRAVVPED